MAEPEIQESRKNEDFSHEQLTIAWMEIAEHYQNSKNLFITMAAHKPVKSDDAKPTVVVENKIQKNELEERLTEILPELRRKLNNQDIQMVIRVSGKAYKAKAYTPQEKFNEMAEKNPALKNLKEQLGLELDY